MFSLVESEEKKKATVKNHKNNKKLLETRLFTF